MIVVNSSALLAILFAEPEQAAFEQAIYDADRCVISAVNGHESACILRARFGPAGVERFWALLETSVIEVAPFDEAQMRIALATFALYGKGLHSAARLNLADCAAYALAKTFDAPLLFKGNDFAATDIRPAAES